MPPPVETRFVACSSLWQINANGIAFAVAVIVLAKLLTQPRGLDPHKRIHRGVKRLGTFEDF